MKMYDVEAFQVIDQASLKSLKHDLRGERKLGFVRARSAIEFEMYSQMKAKYPTWTKIMSSIAGSEHCLGRIFGGHNRTYRRNL